MVSWVLKPFPIGDAASPERDYRLIRISLSDGSALFLRMAYLIPLWPGDAMRVPGWELSAEEGEALQYAARCFHAERAALRLVARAEQCRAVLARKLAVRGYPGPCVAAAIAYLDVVDLVNDGRYARLWLTYHVSHGARSPRALFQGLCRRGLPQDTIKAALQAVLDPELEGRLLRRFLQKTRRQSKKQSQTSATLKRTLRFEGFSPALIARLLEEERFQELCSQSP
ncbi:MAG: recombination regulator RecX [Treponema sp.]|nr:recombination regulator RecX [Treponema sp.]